MKAFTLEVRRISTSALITALASLSSFTLELVDVFERILVSEGNL